jgi:hypothetical protein
LAIYVDSLRRHREAWAGETCHLATDGPIDELHAFAHSIGVPRIAFHGWARWPHYDLRAPHRARAVAAGAIEVTSKELVRRCFLRRGAER